MSVIACCMLSLGGDTYLRLRTGLSGRVEYTVGLINISEIADHLPLSSCWYKVGSNSLEPQVYISTKDSWLKGKIDM